jgi:hypothetical protein
MHVLWRHHLYCLWNACESSCSIDRVTVAYALLTLLRLTCLDFVCLYIEPVYCIGCKQLTPPCSMCSVCHNQNTVRPYRDGFPCFIHCMSCTLLWLWLTLLVLSKPPFIYTAVKAALPAIDTVWTIDMVLVDFARVMLSNLLCLQQGVLARLSWLYLRHRDWCDQMSFTCRMGVSY